MEFKTVEQTAQELGKAKNSITAALRKLGVKKTAGVYLITPEIMEKLKTGGGKAGRPKGAKNKPKPQAES
jgi:hypothetical protein